jgi:hypothetical protein
VLSWDFSHSSVETSCWQNITVHQEKGVALLKICFQWMMDTAIHKIIFTKSTAAILDLGVAT